jgi:hypothetical protein
MEEYNRKSDMITFEGLFLLFFRAGSFSRAAGRLTTGSAGLEVGSTASKHKVRNISRAEAKYQPLGEPSDIFGALSVYAWSHIKLLERKIVPTNRMR